MIKNRYVWILLVGLLAMGGALRADFYMDDFMFIVNPAGSGPAEFSFHLGKFTWGSTAEGAMPTTIFQIIPTLITLVMGYFFPVNPIATHVVNLGIHLVLALFVYSKGKALLLDLEVLRNPETCKSAAFVGALIFACHPLGTEPVHYAKCHMVQLVAFFAFWATCDAVAFLKAPSNYRFPRIILPALLCMFSYFPGTVILIFNFLVLLAFRPQFFKDFIVKFMGDPKHRGLKLFAAACLIAIVGYATWFFLERFRISLLNGSYVYPTHIVTQGRVFWEYLVRLFVPVGLASDHFQPWSTWRDAGAVVKLIGFVLLTIFILAMAVRKGPAARKGIFLLMSFVLIPFAMRILYFNIEIMVEYRAYNALPWFSILAGWGFVVLSARLRGPLLPWLPATCLIAVFSLLSVQRGATWRSAELLARDVIERYPLNNRARLQLALMSLNAGEANEVLNLHEEAKNAQSEIIRYNASTGGRGMIDPIRSNLVWIGSFVYAVAAVEQLEGPQSALKFADNAIAVVRQQLPSSFDPIPNQKKVAATPLLNMRDKMIEQIELSKIKRDN